MSTDEKRNPKVSDFTDIADAYAKSEELAHQVKFENGLANAFQKLRDQFGKAGDKVSLEKCQVELEVQSFVFVEGKVHPLFVMEFPFPDLSKYSDENLTYLKDRHASVKNPTLKARYAHLLWESKIKHVDFAKSAIDSYIDSIKQIQAFELVEPKKSRGHRITKSIESLWVLSSSVSYKIQESVELITNTFLNYAYNNPSSCSVRLFILNLGLGDWKNLGFHLYQHVETVFEKQKTMTDLFGVMEWLLILGRIDSKQKLKTVQWKTLLGAIYEELAEAFLKNENPAGGSYLVKAIEIYKSLKNATKVSELEKKYDKAKKSVRFGSHQQSIDLTKPATEAANFADTLIKENGTGILSYLRDNPTLIPKISDIRLESESMLEDMPLQRDMPQTILDHRGNAVEHFSTREEIKRKWDLYTYNFHIECEKILLLRAIFIKGVEAGAITPDSFETYLRDETWLSYQRKAWSPAVESEETFLELVLPSIRYFIGQTKSVLENSKQSPDFVLCADSLALKIEGLLRDLCEQSGEVTFFMRDDKGGRKVVNEQDINSLLYTTTIKNLFSEDQLFFLRFILIEKAGVNWRHKVAHSLSFFPEYSFNLMVQLIMCLLIVAKKKVERK